MAVKRFRREPGACLIRAAGAFDDAVLWHRRFDPRRSLSKLRADKYMSTVC